MNRSESVAKLMPALIKAALEFQPAVKNAENPHFKSKFVDLAGVHAAIDQALLKHGLIALQPTRIGEDGRTIVETSLFHESGEFLSGEYPVTASQAGPQGEGSGLTYARRYALLAMVGIAPEDDDAEAATTRSAPRNGNTAPAPTPTEIRGRISALAKSRNLTPQEVADDFVTWSEGIKIGTANAETLLKYIDYLNKGQAA